MACNQDFFCFTVITVNLLGDIIINYFLFFDIVKVYLETGGKKQEGKKLCQFLRELNFKKSQHF